MHFKISNNLLNSKENIKIEDCNKLLIRLLSNNEIEHAGSFFENFSKANIIPNDISYSYLIEAYLYNKQINLANSLIIKVV